MSGVSNGIKRCRLLVILFVLQSALAAQQQPKFFSFSRFSGALTLRYQMTDEEEFADESLLREVTRQFLEGGIQLDTTGGIYHPNFLTFRVNANLIGHRQKTQYSEDPVVNNTINNTYNIRLLFLKKKKVNVDLYTLRNVFTADRAFLERFFTTFTNTGLTLRTRTKSLPFQLDLYSNHIKSESLTYSERDEKTKNADLRMDLIKAARTRSIFHVKFKDYSESVYQVDYRSLEMNGNFTHNYGIRDRNMATSFLSYHRMQGYYDLETFHARINNIHYLKPYLHLNTTYTLNGDNSLNRSFKKHDAVVLLNHRLFESLISQVLMGGRFEDSNYQEVSGFRYGVDLRYKKKIPTGSIILNYLTRRENATYTSRSDITETAEVYDFSLTDTIILTFPGIETGSIRVLSPDLTQVYIEGVDFQVDILQDVVTITRLPGGAIEAGTEVLVRFRYTSFPDFHLRLRNTQFLFRINILKYLHIFYNSTVNRQDIRSDYLIPPYESYDKKLLGAQIVSRPLNVSYTYEDYNSNLADYYAHNFRLSGQVNPFKWLKLAGNVGINRVVYDPESLYNYFNAYTLECGYTPGNNINANALYRRIRYETPSQTRDRESVVFKFQWHFRKIILDFFYEHILTTTLITERGHDFFSVMIRRTF